MRPTTIQEVTNKLIGPVRPVGETHEDNIRFENLKALCEVIDRLMGDVSDVRAYSHSSEFSKVRAAEYAANFIREIKEADD